jgi:hypothetical protein
MKSILIEGRYDALVTELSRRLLKVVKDSISCTQDVDGKFAGKRILFDADEEVPNIDSNDFPEVYFEEVENATIPVEFYLTLKIQWVRGLDDYRIGGDVYNDTKRTSDEMPLIEIRLELDPADYPNILSAIAMDLRDTLRHEIEHTTQSGWNTINSKYIKSDMPTRNKINAGELPPYRYFLLRKEIPAMIQGMYLKAKKKREPFKDVVNQYLNIWVNNGSMTAEQKQEIIDTWRIYLPKLAIRQEL